MGCALGDSIKRLIASVWHGHKRTRVPLSVWEAYLESSPTNAGTPPKEALARMSADHLVDFMADHFGSSVPHKYLRYLREDLDADRGEKSLL
jgi:hypothetical protein